MNITLKTLSLFVAGVFSSCMAFAQYHGGTNDGFQSLLSTNLNTQPLIYRGGIDDGSSLNTALILNTPPAIYYGGINDGTASSLAAALNIQPTIYFGGINDGAASLLSTTLNTTPTIYFGGNNDGYTSLTVSNLNPIVPLSVTILSFSGEWKNDDAVLSWETASEEDLDHFELERSTDGGLNFSTIVQLNSTANTNSGAAYQYFDSRAYELPTNFLLYRLKTVDRNGVFMYSAIARLAKNKTAPVLILYPNPTSGRFTLEIRNSVDISGYSFLMTTINGAIIKKGTITQSSTAFDLSSYPAAYYFVSVYREGDIIQQFKIMLTK